MSEYGVELKQDYVGNYDTRQTLSFSYHFTQNLIKKTDCPSAIVYYNDQIALKVLEALRDEGLKVPDDISLIGYDDSALAVASEIKFTTVKHSKMV